MNATTKPSTPVPTSTIAPGEPWVTQFLRNRPLYQLADLQPYEGQWVAFSKDGARIVAADLDLAALEQKLAEVGQDPQQVVFEQIWFADDCFVGGAEYL